jgi:glycosyltransferase involved in cell wall biosynthesis
VPAVSVILPTYNRAATLGRAVQTVLSQDFADLELIVVDDRSTDATPQVLRSIGDSRVRVIRCEVNGGPARARNLGVGAARSQWLAFQDSDDEWLPGKLSAQWARARAGADVGLVIGGYDVDDGRARVRVRPSSTLDRGDARPDLLDGWPIITPLWLVRKAIVDALGGFDHRYPVFEDHDLVLRISDRCGVAAVEGPLLVKHGSTDALCGNPVNMRDGMRMLLEQHGARWADFPEREARRRTHLGFLQYGSGQVDAARASFRRATRLRPLSPAPLFLLASHAGRGVFRLEKMFPRFAGMAL